MLSIEFFALPHRSRGSAPTPPTSRCAKIEHSRAPDLRPYSIALLRAERQVPSIPAMGSLVFPLPSSHFLLVSSLYAPSEEFSLVCHPAESCAMQERDMSVLLRLKSLNRERVESILPAQRPSPRALIGRFGGVIAAEAGPLGTRLHVSPVHEPLASDRGGTALLFQSVRAPLVQQFPCREWIEPRRSHVGSSSHYSAFG